MKFRNVWNLHLNFVCVWKTGLHPKWASGLSGPSDKRSVFPTSLLGNRLLPITIIATLLAFKIRQQPFGLLQKAVFPTPNPP